MLTRSLWAALALVAFAGSAEAAALRMSSSDYSAFSGQTFEITIRADSEGAIAGDRVFVILSYDPTLVIANGGTSGQFGQFGIGLPSIVGDDQGSCDWAAGRENQCLVFDQTFVVPAAAANPGVVFATFSFTARRTHGGYAAFSFQDIAPDDFVFFDLGNATDVGTAPSGWTVDIVGELPEPHTGALLTLGLLGLGVRNRRNLR